MIYDCFTFFNELDILNVRLHEMSPVVDRFVLVEATRTFQGAPKPLHYAENKAMFAKFADKIIHVVTDIPEDLPMPRDRKFRTMAWAREHYQRDQIGRGLIDAQAGDLVIVSDVDEIIAADKLRDAIKSRRRHDLTVFTMPHYVHFVNRRVRGVTWLRGPRMIEFECFTSGQKMRMSRCRPDREIGGSLPRRMYMLARNVPRRIRTRVVNFIDSGIGARITEIPEAGWHLKSIGSWEVFRQKLSAYSHEEHMESEEFNSERALMRSILETTYEVPLKELPAFVRRNPDAFPLLHDEGACGVPA